MEELNLFLINDISKIILDYNKPNEYDVLKQRNNDFLENFIFFYKIHLSRQENYIFFDEFHKFYFEHYKDFNDEIFDEEIIYEMDL